MFAGDSIFFRQPSSSEELRLKLVMFVRPWSPRDSPDLQPYLPESRACCVSGPPSCVLGTPSSRTAAGSGARLSKMETTVEALSEDLLRQIFFFLDNEDIKSCEQVS